MPASSTSQSQALRRPCERSAHRERATNKRQPSIPIPRRLRARLHRARARTRSHVIEHDGRPIANISKGFRAAVQRAGLEGVTPHTLRHTAITWAMMRGQRLHDVSHFFGVSYAVLEKTYAHHHPDYLKEIADAV